MAPAKKKARRQEEVTSSGAEMGDKEDAFTVSNSWVRSAYCLHCTVCENNYDSRVQWLSHLGTPEHQTLARLECFRTWGEDKEMRECVVAVFCSFPLTNPGTVEDLLERFSSAGVDFLVTDFVWWPERPRVGFLQFESRVKVAEVLKGLENGSNGFVQDKLVQLKKAVDILNLEWKELLPFDGNDIPQPSAPYTSSSNPADRFPSSVSSPPPDPSPLINLLPFPPSCIIPVPRTPLQHQFNYICQSTEIPEPEFEHARQIVQTMQQVLRKMHPSGEVLMLRNYYLRLRNNGNDILLLFAYIAESVSFPDSYGFLSLNDQDAILSEFSRLVPGYKRLQLDQCPVEGFPFQHELTGFLFNFTTHSHSIAEAQLCRLLQYLCTFDPRVRPLLTLIHFWAKCRNVRIAEEHISKAIVHSNCPEPVALEWMVILFLIRKGILPSVREILQCPHKLLLLNKFNKDIGFSCDPEYVREWTTRAKSPPPEVNTEKFLLSVVKLAQQFFNFYSTSMKKGCWLLNPKDGEMIQREGHRYHGTKLTSEETSALSEGNKKHLKVDRFRIYMIHPLVVWRKLSFCVDTWRRSTCQKMRDTAEALDTYLKLMGTGGGGGSGQSLDSVLAGVGINGPKNVGAK